MPHVEMPTVSKVIPFRPDAVVGRRERDGQDSERGRILLFTGVRYGRLEDEPNLAADLLGDTQVERDEPFF